VHTDHQRHPKSGKESPGLLCIPLGQRIMKDRNDLVSDSSLTLVESGKIIDLGQIVGITFTSSRELHGFTRQAKRGNSV